MVRQITIRVDDKVFEKVKRVKERHSDTWAMVLDKYVRIYR